MKVFIVTGTSRGIGEAIVAQLMNEKHSIYCISRTENDYLIRMAIETNTRLNYYTYDLSESIGIDHLLIAMLHTIKQETDVKSIYLINNAGILSPVAPVETCKTNSIINNVTINLLAPMILTSRFIELTHDLDIDKRILNVSSGSAKYLLPSQSCYSTSKAGLDTFSKSINLEQQQARHPVKVVSVYPGMIDTQMQAEIRSVSKESFPHVQQFIQLEQEGMLQTAEYTANKLLDLLFSEDYGRLPLIEQL